MIGQTNSLVGGKETLVYAEPLPSQILHKDDKVFIKKADLNAEQSLTVEITGTADTTNTYVVPFFINDAIAVCLSSHYDMSLKYFKYSTGWSSLSGAFEADALGFATFRSLARGDFLVINGKHFLLHNESRCDDLSCNGIYYAGKFGNNDYAVSSVDGSVYLYDWEIKSSGNQVHSCSLSYAAHGTDENANLLFVQDTNMAFHLFGFANNAFTEVGSSALTGFIVAYTGLDVGDYLFTVEPHGAIYNKNYLSYSDTDYEAGDGTCHLKIYVSDGQGGVTPISASSPLYRFTQEKAIAHYDSRTHILFIGTTSEIHFFYWDETDHTFTEVQIEGIVLPTNPDGNHIYNAAISPQFINLMVYCGNAGSGGRNVKIYDLDCVASGDWKVVSATDAATAPDMVFSAIATGNTDDAGQAELKVALPTEISVAVDVTPTPDSFIFLGDE